MAKVTITLEDEGEIGGIRLNMTLDRSSESEELREFPATPAMLEGLCVRRLFERDVLSEMTKDVCADILLSSGMSADNVKTVIDSIDG